jgi:hypothetical protein
MSEFTIGILTRAKHREAVAGALTETGLTYKQRDLNPDWTAFFLADEWDEAVTTTALDRASRRAPVLSFMNAEDHGWGYRLWRMGNEVAALQISYELEFQVAQEIFAERYPGEDPFESDASVSKWMAIREQMQQSDRLTAATKELYQRANPAAFGALDLTPEQIEELKMVLNPAWRGEDGAWGQAERFKEILGIEEMTWLSYEHADAEIFRQRKDEE